MRCALPTLCSVIPKSRCGFPTSIPKVEESTALQELIRPEELSNAKRDGVFIEILLSNFVIYRPDNKHNPYKMEGLQFLQTRFGHTSYLFDGSLSVGRKQRHVQGVLFRLCSIGNYGTEYHDIGSKVWIQSELNLNAGSDIYYRLGTCSSEYSPYHEGFLWTANLAKYFVDYLESCEHDVSIHNFRSDFSVWMRHLHKKSAAFQRWYQQLGTSDFRRAVVINIAFLYKESLGVDKSLKSQKIWSEVFDMDSVPEQVIKEDLTIVTPFVYECFKHMRFGHLLKAVEPLPTLRSRQITQEDGSSPTNPHNIPSENLNSLPCYPIKIKMTDIRVGYVLAVTKDGNGSFWKDENCRWKEESEDFWYAYIHTIYYLSGKHEFEALWLYRPSDTCCAKMKYPFPNELFLSDNCTCRAKVRIQESEILGVVPVTWYERALNYCSTPFVRQTYIQNERFETLQSHHKECVDCCKIRKKSTRASISIEKQYPIGQPVLVLPPSKTSYDLEVYEVARYITVNNRLWVILRCLRRRWKIDGKGRPNELVYTDLFENKLLPDRIKEKCLVRIYSETEVSSGLLPAPYSRGGAGNAFFISTRLVETDGISSLKPIETCFPESLIQGFDPMETPRHKVLRGMDLYSGAGNFGRGLEEGGAVRNEYAVDINKQAIHTYSANLRHGSSTKLYYGSVNDLLLQALQGNPKNSDLIPLPGDVDFISAGSPCQGFSKLNQNPNNESGLKNQSMVASVAAYIDFYRPKYGILENVMTMAQKGQGRDEDVLSQLISAVVGIGYQLQLFVVDAWSCGHPQSRTRLFVSFAAPGLELLKHPALSHSHLPHVTDRGLGQLANGQPFGRRIHELTAFNFVSASEATEDLPKIGNGSTNHCIQQPDHIVSIGMTLALRAQIEAIPRFPRGMNFQKAWDGGLGVMSPEQRDLFPKLTRSGRLPENVSSTSIAWGRVDPLKLFSTIVVHLTPSDARTGHVLHWDDDRPLTIMEGRRAQGYPDDEILLGNLRDAWKLLGNSVARNVALSLGLSLREAWLKCNPIENGKLSPAQAHQTISDDAARGVPKVNCTEFLRNTSQFTTCMVLGNEKFQKNDDILAEKPAMPLLESSLKLPSRRIASNKARRTRPSQELKTVSRINMHSYPHIKSEEQNEGRLHLHALKPGITIQQARSMPTTMGSDDELSLDPAYVRFRTPTARKAPLTKGSLKGSEGYSEGVETSFRNNMKRPFKCMNDYQISSSFTTKKLRRLTVQSLSTIRASMTQPSVHERAYGPGSRRISTQKSTHTTNRGPAIPIDTRLSRKSTDSQTTSRRRASKSGPRVFSDHSIS